MLPLSRTIRPILSNSSRMSQNIVVVGGGGAGIAVSKALAAQLPRANPQYKVVLVTAREVYVHLLAMLRMFVNPAEKLENSAFIPYNALIPENAGSVKFGSVNSVVSGTSGGEIILENGERIPYRYLVAATGSLWGGPLSAVSGSKDEIIQASKSWQEKFKKAQNIAIVGGGSVGLELAGEIRDLYPDVSKKITIVQGDSLPLNPTYADKFRAYVQERWEKCNVDFALSERLNFDNIEPDANGNIYTESGRPIRADLVVTTTGGRPNTKWLESLSPSVLDDAMRVKVEPTLQVTGYPDIFAAGDIINTIEQKQLMKTQWHAGVIVQNIMSLIKGGTAQKEYTTTLEALMITCGKSAGAGVLNKFWRPTFGDWFVSKIKGKNLFVDIQRRAMNQPA